MSNIAGILQQQAQRYSDRPAIIDIRYQQTLSFGELEQQVSHAAGLLHQAGLQPGDAVLIFQPMSAQLYVALLAVFRLGLIAMFVDPSAGIEHLERCCGMLPPNALIASAKAHVLRVRSRALRQIPVKFAIGLPAPGAIHWSKTKRESVHANVADCTPDTPALLTFTSGSTGQPKAALRTQGFLLAQHQVLATSLGLAPGQVDLTTLPIFVLANLASGVTSLIPNADLRFPRKINAASVFQQIERYQPVSTAASPAFMMRLVEFCEHHHLSLSSFDRMFTGGAPVFPPLLKRLQAIAPQAEVITVYGSTEAEPIAHIAYDQMRSVDLDFIKRGAGLLVGKPVPEIEVRIIGDRWGTPLAPVSQAAFEAACLPMNAIGEIVVSGDHVLPSYLNGQDNAETKFAVDGVPWHRTGDAGYLDEQGRLWLLGRCKARIQDQHGVIYPFAVEAVALEHPEIRRAACISRHGKRMLMLEALSQTPETLLSSLRSDLAAFQIEDYKFLNNIPVDRRHNAKIDYPALDQVLNQHGL